MFILTNVNVNQDLVRIYDTNDNTNDIVSLSVIANKVLSNTIRVYGIGNLNKARRSDIVAVAPLGIYICFNEAKEALASEYIKRGMSKADAYVKVGLA